MDREMFEYAIRRTSDAAKREAQLSFRRDEDRSRYMQGVEFALAEMFNYAPPPTPERMGK